MKAHQPIIVITLSCLLLLASACGKKSVRGVSGVEDLSASEGNHELAGHDKDFSDDPLAQFEEAFLEDGEDSGAVEALSASDLYDGNGETKLAGMEQAGSSSVFSALTRSGVSGFSGGVLGMENNNGASGVLTKGRLGATGSSLGVSAADEAARRNDAHFSKALRDVFFEYDSWRLSEQSHLILESNAKWLKAHPHARITIEGHCDERGTQAYNYVLGERRAETVKRYLSHLGVSSYQMVVVSYGKDRPVCHVFSAACFRSNRRAHFAIDVNTASRD